VIEGALVGFAERRRTLPREVGCRLQALTVIAGKRCRDRQLVERQRLHVELMLARSRCGSSA
jgi:hypothetical protein